MQMSGPEAHADTVLLEIICSRWFAETGGTACGTAPAAEDGTVKTLAESMLLELEAFVYRAEFETASQRARAYRLIFVLRYAVQHA